MKIGKLSTSQLTALRAANVDVLISAYGNEFFVSGQAGVDYARANPDLPRHYQRNTLESLRKLGLLSYTPGPSGRGEYTITKAGRKAIQ